MNRFIVLNICCIIEDCHLLTVTQHFCLMTYLTRLLWNHQSLSHCPLLFWTASLPSFSSSIVCRFIFDWKLLFSHSVYVSVNASTMFAVHIYLTVNCKVQTHSEALNKNGLWPHWSCCPCVMWNCMFAFILTLVWYDVYFLIRLTNIIVHCWKLFECINTSNFIINWYQQTWPECK